MSGFVYFLREGDYGPIKIGWAEDPEKRRGTLQTGNSRPLVLLGQLPGTVQDEHAWHARFHKERIIGEWFTATPQLLVAVAGSQPPLYHSDRFARFVLEERLEGREHSPLFGVETAPPPSARTLPARGEPPRPTQVLWSHVLAVWQKAGPEPRLTVVTCAADAAGGVPLVPNPVWVPRSQVDPERPPAFIDIEGPFYFRHTNPELATLGFLYQRHKAGISLRRAMIATSSWQRRHTSIAFSALVGASGGTEMNPWSGNATQVLPPNDLFDWPYRCRNIDCAIRYVHAEWTAICRNALLVPRSWEEDFTMTQKSIDDERHYL